MQLHNYQNARFLQVQPKLQCENDAAAVFWRGCTHVSCSCGHGQPMKRVASMVRPTASTRA